MNTLAKNITEIRLAHGERIFIAPMRTKDVVSFEGSVFGGSNMLPRQQSQVPMLAIELLDAGTKTKTKEVIRGTLAARGATLSFSAGGDRMYFTGACLPEDLPIILKIVAECLTEPSLPTKELSSAKERELGGFEEEKTHTKVQGGIVLSQEIFDSKHVNYADSTSTKIKGVTSATRTEVASFAKRLGRGGLVLAITGDVEVSSATRAVRSALGKLSDGTISAPAKKKNEQSLKSVEKLIRIADKATIDTYIGTAVPLTNKDDLYLPFVVMLDMLGGHGLSSGHLMRTIREEQGLTYGIYADPYGFGGGADGAMRIWATFSPDTYKKAVASTLAEINNFFKKGITDKALATKQDEITGRYLVGLSTTRGLARMLHFIGNEDKPLSYIDEYPSLIRALTSKNVRDAASFVSADKLTIVAAGTFAK